MAALPRDVEMEIIQQLPRLLLQRFCRAWFHHLHVVKQLRNRSLHLPHSQTRERKHRHTAVQMKHTACGAQQCSIKRIGSQLTDPSTIPPQPESKRTSVRHFEYCPLSTTSEPSKPLPHVVSDSRKRARKLQTKLQRSTYPHLAAARLQHHHRFSTSVGKPRAWAGRLKHALE